MKRDGRKCRACASKKDLELCHITPASTFAALEDSYAEDNLMILCVRCHEFHEWRGRTSESLDALVDKLGEAKEHLFSQQRWREAFHTKAMWEWAREQRLREAQAYRAQVEALFALARFERGYTTAQEFYLLQRQASPSGRARSAARA